MPPWELTREMVLSEREAAHLLNRVRDAAAGGDPDALTDRLIVEGLLHSGLRTSEFCRLRLADTILGQRESVFVVTSGEGRRVHIPRELSQLVRAYVRTARRPAPQSTTRSTGRPTDHLIEPLLLNERGRPYERTGLYRRVVRILTQAGFGDRASVQLLRHTYGYLAYLRTGGNLLFVQRQLGHAHPMITSVYERLVTEDYAALAEVTSGSATPASRPRRARRTAPRQGATA